MRRWAFLIVGCVAVASACNGIADTTAAVQSGTGNDKARPGEIIQLSPTLLPVLKPNRAFAKVNFEIGSMLADNTHNLAYVLDNTDNLLLAIDTDSGKVAKSTKLLSSSGNGQMALAPEGDRLYVALTVSNRIQVFSLPDLQQMDAISLDFTPVSLAAASDGQLYVSSNKVGGGLHQIDPDNGLTTGSFGQKPYYSGPAIRTNSDHSSLFVVERGLRGVGRIDQYAVKASEVPTRVHSYSLTPSNTRDIVIDDDYHRIYSASVGAYGVGVMDMSTGDNRIWKFPDQSPYGTAVAFLPGGKFVYGAGSSTIRCFDRTDGTPLTDYQVTSTNEKLMPGDMVVTPNGRVLFGVNKLTGDTKSGIDGTLYRLGLLGSSVLDLKSGLAAPSIYLGADQNVKLSQGASLTASVSGSAVKLPVTWLCINGPEGGAKITSDSTHATISFNVPGTYQIQAEVADGDLRGSDLININVRPDQGSPERLNPIGQTSQLLPDTSIRRSSRFYSPAVIFP